MPPRLLTPAALRAPIPNPSTLLIRAFSSSTAVASASASAPPPPRQNFPRSPSSSSHSSSNSLLSINKTDRPARHNNSNSNYYNKNNTYNRSNNASGGGSNNASGSTPHRSDAASRLLDRYKDRAEAAVRSKQAQLEYLRNRKNSGDYLKQMPRRWDAGEVYSPHDLSPVEMQKWRKRSPRSGDVVDALGIRPLDMYKVCCTRWSVFISTRLCFSLFSQHFARGLDMLAIFDMMNWSR